MDPLINKWKESFKLKQVKTVKIRGLAQIEKKASIKTMDPNMQLKGTTSSKGLKKRLWRVLFKSRRTQDMAPSPIQERHANVDRETRNRVELEWNNIFIIKNMIFTPNNPCKYHYATRICTQFPIAHWGQNIVSNLFWNCLYSNIFLAEIIIWNSQVPEHQVDS